LRPGTSPEASFPGPGVLSGRPAFRALIGPAIVVLAVIPFVLAAFVWSAQGEELAGLGLLGACPMLELSGIPCAGCGGSRAFYYLVHGDAAALDYNWFWPLATLALLGYGVVLTVRAARGDELFGPAVRGLAERFAAAPWRTGGLTAAVFAIPWLIAIFNLESINAG
jgi:hypothetical protein